MSIPFNKIIEVSYALLDRNLNPKYRHFSFILDGSHILKVGLNQQKTHPITLKYKYFTNRIHSELSACIRLGFENAQGLIMVNTRIGLDNNKLANSKPCFACQNLCKQLQFKEIWFTNQFGEFEALYL
jgi:hypothetical protein